MSAPTLPNESPTRADSQLSTLLTARIAAGALELPVLSDTATRVLSVAGDTNCDARALAELIQRDQSLAGNVLRVANSAAYAPREPIVSLQQSVSRLGFSTVCGIAVAVAMQGKLFTIKGREDELRAMWVHSAAAGAWAKELARLQRRNVEGAFFTGLLHDVGRPVVLQALLEIERTARTGAAEVELQAVIDEFHAPVGAEMIKRWALPEWMALAIRWHHEPALAPVHSEFAALTRVADLLAHWSLAPVAAALARAPGDAPLPRAPEDAAIARAPGHESLSDAPANEVLAQLKQDAALAALGIYSDELETLLERRAEIVRLAGAFA